MLNVQIQRIRKYLKVKLIEVYDRKSYFDKLRKGPFVFS